VPTYDAEAWVRAVAVLAALPAVTLLYGVVIRSSVAWAGGSRCAHPLVAAFLHFEWRPLYVALVGLTTQVAVAVVLPPSDLRDLVTHGVVLAIIAAVGWALIRVFDVAERALLERFPISVSDNLRARRIYTQFTALRRVAVALVGLFTVAAMLMTFDAVRQLGVGLLASAGLAGIIIGMAAQPLVANILASMQVALTEPFRVDDVMIVEGVWGRIEEITLTYVVVRIWDLRRLVIPISYFVQRPFQNWTRVSADLLGTVFIYTDYSVPVDAVRAELHRILDAAPLWDRQVWGLQVTDSKERTLELRALMSAPTPARRGICGATCASSSSASSSANTRTRCPASALRGPSDRVEAALRGDGNGRGGDPARA